MNGFAWLPIFGGPWGGGTFYPGGEVVPLMRVVSPPGSCGYYYFSRDGRSLVWSANS